MAEHDFELTIKEKLTDARLDALVEAGCDDATFSAKDDLTFAAFTREAGSLLDAVVSAIEAVESVEGLEVLGVEPDEPVWASEIAARTGRSRQSVDQLVKGQRGPGGFPPPASHATRNPLWRWSEVEAWFAEYEGRPPRRRTVRPHRCHQWGTAGTPLAASRLRARAASPGTQAITRALRTNAFTRPQNEPACPLRARSNRHEQSSRVTNGQCPKGKSALLAAPFRRGLLSALGRKCLR